ncbi:MAG: hypothetical protein NC483_03425 [Ruminococcus sp.]|nr:hypothetical protein [Ruminococcus sp.]
MEFYVDLGSSTIKVYKYEEQLELLEEHSIYFKNDFSKTEGISLENKKELIEYFKTLKDKYNMKYENTNIYVTGIFRELIPEKKQEMVKLFNDELDLHFNIISHGIENYYLGKAMEHDYNNKKVMIINMGGKTTELVIFDKGSIVDRKNLTVGVADLMNAFPEVNESISAATIEDMNDFVKERLADISFDNDYDCAIFTGGEERFEKLTNFNLVPNTLFDDGIHKYMLSLEDYIVGTKKVFDSITLQELYDLMPGNPKWMDGARPGAIIPLAIFELANIKTIIPSDLNLINGVINDK